MPGISRNGDLGATGHGCSKVAPVRATQKTVFANGKPILKRGDPMAPHEILVPAIPPICLKHKANLKGADPTVFVTGIGVGRRGDRVDKGSMMQSSKNVFASGVGGATDPVDSRRPGGRRA